MSEYGLLNIENLKVEFSTDRSKITAIDSVSLNLINNQTLGIVGESGCGKSVTALAIMGLLPNHAKVSGRILFNGEDLIQKKDHEMIAIRGKKISMIFQEPMTSLNPVFTIEDQLGEVLIMHHNGTKKSVKEKVVNLLKLVGIPNPERRMKDYPHCLSGGMRQRVMIAMALACEPDILIADEPTTALDVTIQAQILILLKKLQKEFSTGLIVISHDLGVIAQIANQVAVMYAGVIMEYTSVKELFSKPLHPYTKGLLKTIPSISVDCERLAEIKGMVPHLSMIPAGCRFNDRCADKIPICSKKSPELIDMGEHKVRCWLYSST
jgi:oligopeptide/dipeptide ABC transporter ATP-binding protein